MATGDDRPIPERSSVADRSHPAKRSADRRARKGAQFVAELGSLRNGASSSRRFVGDGVLDDLAVTGSHVEADEPIHVEATIEAVHDGVLATGSLTTRWQGICRRCLEDATGELTVKFCELCVEVGDEETTYPLGTEELVLDPIVHDACILHLPLAPLCAADCLGICAQCGANRNVDACSCAANIDPRWSGLSVLSSGRGEPSARDAMKDHRS